jgi:hypothetical protein
VSARIEGLAYVVEPVEAQSGQQRKGMVEYCPYSLDEGSVVGAGVLDGTIQIVHDRQPPGGHVDPLGRTSPGNLSLRSLTEIVEISEGPPEGHVEVGLDRFGAYRLIVGQLRGGIARLGSSVLVGEASVVPVPI